MTNMADSWNWGAGWQNEGVESPLSPLSMPFPPSPDFQVGDHLGKNSRRNYSKNLLVFCINAFSIQPLIYLITSLTIYPPSV
jgi:hypothetical protein